MLADSPRVFSSRHDGQEHLCILGKVFQLFSEDDVMHFCINLFFRFDIIGKNLMTFLGQIGCHWESHVAQPHKAHLGEGEGHSRYKIHLNF